MKLLLLFTCCLCCFMAGAQKNTIVFGKIDKAELKMTTCDFDRKAEALVLYESGDYFCDIRPTIKSSVYIQLERHVRIKILNDKGLSKANIRIRYLDYTDKEYIKKIAAQTFNLDAAGNVQISKLDKKLLYNKRISKRYSEIAFTLPNVKAGSVIEYKYMVESLSIPDWYFQKSIPVRESKFTVDFPVEFEMSCIPHCTLPIKNENKSSSYRDLQMYRMENIPALRDEPFMSCEKDYLQRLETRIDAVNPRNMPSINMVKSWPGVVRNLVDDEDFGQQLRRAISGTEDLDRLLNNVTDPAAKMMTIHNYVRQHMTWNGYDNIWSVDGIKNAWRKRKGSSGEINLILIKLLKDAGLDASPVLLSSRDNGRIDMYVADHRQFNKVLAYVKINHKTYVLDGSEKYTPSTLIPFDVMLTDGLVIENTSTYESDWQSIWDDQQLNSNDILLDAQIDEQGNMRGAAYITSGDFAKVERLPKIKEGKTPFIEEFITARRNAALKIDSISFENTTVDSLPLIQKIQFSQALISTGDYKSFSANLFSGLTKNVFVSDDRFSDISFGCNQRLTITGSFIIPGSFDFEELPKNIRMMMPDTGIIFTRISAIENNHLSVRLSLEFNKPVFTTDEYPAFKEFYKKLFDLLNEQYVIRKKINP